MDTQTSESAVPLIRFEYSEDSAGAYDTTVIVSPFYPFNHFFIKQLIDRLDLPKSRIIYTEFPHGFQKGKKSFTITDLIAYFRKQVTGHEGKVILIGFSIFAVVFSVIYSEENIDKLILFEPDFSNLLLQKLFDSEVRFLLFKSSFLLKFFSPGKIEKQFVHKLRVRYFKSYFFSVRSYLKENKIFKPLVEKAENIHIFWNIMEKETFPLAQVLSEEYSIDLYKIHKTIYEELAYSVNGSVLKSLERII